MSRRRRRTDVLGLESVMNQLLAEYGDDVYEVSQECLDETVRQAVEDLRSVNHFAPGGRPSGEYSGSWTSEERYKKRWKTVQVVYNEEHYRLTHLLEKGHVSKNGTGRTFGRVSAYPHIAKVEESVKEELPKRIKEAIERL